MDSEYGSLAAYPALPSGRHKLGSEYVDRYQRRRLVVAVAEMAHEEGLAGVTVTRLTSRARISRKTFYDYFENRDACVEYAGQEAATCIFAPAAQLGPQAIGAETAVGRLEALVDAVRAEPNLAELALVHAPALGGAQGQRFQEIAVGAVAGLLSAGGGERLAGAETAASAIIGVIVCRLRRGQVGGAGNLSDELVRLASLPTLETTRSNGPVAEQ